jgi:hypothetical protein
MKKFVSLVLFISIFGVSFSFDQSQSFNVLDSRKAGNVSNYTSGVIAVTVTAMSSFYGSGGDRVIDGPFSNDHPLADRAFRSLITEGRSSSFQKNFTNNDIWMYKILLDGREGVLYVYWAYIRNDVNPVYLLGSSG